MGRSRTGSSLYDFIYLNVRVYYNHIVTRPWMLCVYCYVVLQVSKVLSQLKNSGKVK